MFTLSNRLLIMRFLIWEHFIFCEILLCRNIECKETINGIMVDYCINKIEEIVNLDECVRNTTNIRTHNRLFLPLVYVSDYMLSLLYAGVERKRIRYLYFASIKKKIKCFKEIISYEVVTQVTDNRGL